MTPPLRICLDLDETVVRTVRLEIGAELDGLPGAKKFGYEGDAWLSFLRPGAIELIDFCVGLAPTCYLTSGKTHFQSRIVALHGLPALTVVGRGDHYLLPPARHTILIDDLSFHTMGVQEKLEAAIPDLPFVNRNREPHEVSGVFTLLTVSPWGQPDMGDREMARIKDEIQERAAMILSKTTNS